jgi:hypothetical protein
MKLINLTTTCAALSLIALPAAAHHSPAMFDMTKDIVIEGTVTAVMWGNPHVYFALDVQGQDGRRRQQQVEAGPASNLVTLGMRADSVRAGDRVVVNAKPNRRDPSATALGWVLTKAGVPAIPLHVRAMLPSAPGDAVATSLAGTWVPQGTGFAALAMGARDWPFTEAGRAALVATREARAVSLAACEAFGPPALMALPSTTVVEIDAATVRFKLDTMGVERVVHLDQAAHPAGLEPTMQGHSIGRWEGETLVVDTAGYAASPQGHGFDVPSSATKHVVERFTLTADGKHLDYEATVEDREYFSAPVTHRSQWDYRPDQQPSGLPCDREVAGRFATE